MNILVLSDNHGNRKIIKDILNIEQYDIAIHAGDHMLDDEFMQKHFQYYVSGNNDYSTTNLEQIIDINNTKILLAHGHQSKGLFSRKGISQKMADYAKLKGCNIVVHGHSHVPKIENIDGISVFCPGALAYPRTVAGKTYGIIKIEGTDYNFLIKKYSMKN